MRSTILSLLFLLSSASFSAANYVITSPGTGTIWNKGESVEVLWTGTDEPNVDVRLVHGPAVNLKEYAVLCTNVASSAGKCSYTVDSNIPTGFDYAITVGKDPAKYGYSSFFTIKGKGVLPPPKGCRNFGGQDCPESLPCCSKDGYCGNTPAHCGAGCVAKYSFNGKCGNNSNPAPIKTPVVKMPVVVKPKKCGSKYCKATAPCCSRTNKCGATPKACGTGCQPKKSFGGKCIA